MLSFLKWFCSAGIKEHLTGFSIENEFGLLKALANSIS